MTSEISLSDERPLHWPAGSYRELFAVALPMVLSSSTQSLMHVVDRVFLSRYSMDTVAAALPAGILFWSFLSLPFGIISYLNAFVAQYDGARKPDRVSASVWQGIYFAIVCGGLLLLPAIWSEQIFRAVGHEKNIWTLEANYFRWLCLGGGFALVPAALSCFFSGRGQTSVVLAINLASVGVNALLDWAMIFGHGPFSPMGIVGAAMATNLANLFSTLCYIGLLYYYTVASPYQFGRHFRFDPGLTRDLLRFGGPSGVQMFLDVAGFTAFIMMIGWIGPHELAATNIAFNLNTLAFTPVIGVGIAVSTLVGQRIGEKRPELAATTTWKGFVLGGGIMLLFSTIYVLFPEVLLMPYALRAEAVVLGDGMKEVHAAATNNAVDLEKTRQVVIVLLRFVALYSFFDSMAIIFGSAIRAAGDTIFSMIATCLCAWGLLVLPTYLTWQYYAKSLMLSWVWCSIYVISLGFIFLARFMSGRWKTMSIMEEEPADLMTTEPPADPVDLIVEIDSSRQLDRI